MAATVGISGPSGSGKTLLIEALAHELTSRGVKVGAIKHAPHGFTLDIPGKDSWRLQEAGAVRVAVVGPEGLGLWERGASANLERALSFLDTSELDVVLIEGFKASRLPRIELGAAAASLQPRARAGVLARLPALSSRRQATAAARRLIDTVMQRVAAGPEAEVRVLAGGKPLPLNRVATNLVTQVATALTRGLNGGEEADDITIRVRRRANRSWLAGDGR